MKRRSDTDVKSPNKQQTILCKAAFEKLIAMKASLWKIFSDDVWKKQSRSAVNIIAQLRNYGCLVFLDYTLYAVIDRDVTFTTKNEVTKIVKTSWIVNTKDSNERGRKPTCLKNQIKYYWYDGH